MNKQNQIIKGRINQLSNALNQLMKFGCAITALGINDTGNFIEILPPLDAGMKKKLNGYEVIISGDNDGRHYHWQARVSGCTVRWQSPPSLQTK